MKTDSRFVFEKPIHALQLDWAKKIQQIAYTYPLICKNIYGCSSFYCTA